MWTYQYAGEMLRFYRAAFAATAAGQLLDRAKLIEAVKSAHPGERRGLNPTPVRIWIQSYRQLATRQDIAIVAYEEWQSQGVESAGRLCSAIMRACPATPHGIEWLHVHETWMPKREL